MKKIFAAVLLLLVLAGTAFAARKHHPYRSNSHPYHHSNSHHQNHNRHPHAQHHHRKA